MEDKIEEKQTNGHDDASLKCLKGTIVRRRVLGSHLAFADIKTTTDSSDDDEIVSVAFRSTSFHHACDTNVFPTKKSALPFGAKVEMNLQESTSRNGPKWQVVEWNIIENPSAQALDIAREKQGGFSCSKYLKARGDAFFSLHDPQQGTTAHCPRESIPSSNKHSTLSENNHGRNKSLRAKVFAKWLVDTMGVNENDRVLDIAGGKGLLSVQLAHLARASCTVIDPLIRRKPNMKQLTKLNAPLPQFVTNPFLNNENTISIVMSRCTLLVGLHPDECTEDVLDVALRCNKSVAIVPCCVFVSLFPNRKLKNGRPVVEYDEFIEYLLEKDKRLQQTTLPIEGKNQVIYLNVDCD